MINFLNQLGLIKSPDLNIMCTNNYLGSENEVHIFHCSSGSFDVTDLMWSQ